MSHCYKYLACISALIFTSHIHAEEYAKRPTHASLSKKLAEKQKTEKKHPVNKEQYKSLNSADYNALFTKLVARGMWCDLPKNSIIYIPESLKKHISDKPMGKYTNWRTFILQNRSILADLAVSYDQSFGIEKLTKQQIQSYKALNKIVVATYKNRPVTLNKAALNVAD
jgi:hypothetical protein